MTAATIIAAIIAIFKAIPVLDSWFRELLASYLSSQATETQTQICDAAAMSARAKTDDDRYKAAAAWQSAMSRPR